MGAKALHKDLLESTYINNRVNQEVGGTRGREISAHTTHTAHSTQQAAAAQTVDTAAAAIVDTADTAAAAGTAAVVL